MADKDPAKKKPTRVNSFKTTRFVQITPPNPKHHPKNNAAALFALHLSLADEGNEFSGWTLFRDNEKSGYILYNGLPEKKGVAFSDVDKYAFQNLADAARYYDYFTKQGTAEYTKREDEWKPFESE